MFVTQKRSSGSVDPARRHTNMCYRVLSCILVCSVLVMALSSSVSAGAYEGNVVNLLPADTYLVKTGTADYVESDYPGGTGINSMVQIRWNNSVASTSIRYIYFNIRASVTITTVRFSEYGESVPPTCEYMGTYDGLYQFRMPTESFNFSQFYLRIHFGSESNVNVLVESCYGLALDNIPITYANHNSYYRYFDHSSGESVPTQRHAQGGVIYFPYTCNIRKEVYPNTSFEWNYQINILEIYGTYLDFRNVSEVSILIVSSSITDASVSLNVGGVKEVIPSSLQWMGSAHSWPDWTEEFYRWPLQYYELTFDLTGYDLTGPNACAYIYFDNSPFPYDANWEYVYWSVLGAFYKPYIPEVPWYQTFWTWVKGGFTSVTDTLQSLLGDSSGGALSDAGSEMSDQAAEMNEAQAQLDAVERPTVDSDSLLGNIINFDTGGLNILSAITSNHYTTSLMVVVFTFALCAYIFFGKKG